MRRVKFRNAGAVMPGKIADGELLQCSSGRSFHQELQNETRAAS